MGRRVGSASLSALPVDTPNHHIVVNQTIQEVERMSDVLSDLNSVSTVVNTLQDLGTTDTPTFAGITATATILTNSVQASTIQADNTITGGNFTTAGNVQAVGTISGGNIITAGPIAGGAVMTTTLQFGNGTSMTTAPVQTDWNGSGAAAVLNKPTWIPQSDPGYVTTDTTYTGGNNITVSASNVIAAPTYEGGTGVTISTIGSPDEFLVFIGQDVATSATPTFAGISVSGGDIDTSGGDINTANGAINTGDGFITSTGTVRGETVSFNVGQGLSIAVPTISNVSSIAFQGGSSMTTAPPSWVPQNNPGYQLGLEQVQTLAANGSGSLSLGSNTGFNTRLTYTPPDLTLSGVDITPRNITTEVILADIVESLEFKFGDGTAQTTAVPQSLGTGDSPLFNMVKLTSDLQLDNAGLTKLTRSPYSDNRAGSADMTLSNQTVGGGENTHSQVKLGHVLSISQTMVGTTHTTGRGDIEIVTDSGDITLGQYNGTSQVFITGGFRTFINAGPTGGTHIQCVDSSGGTAAKLHVHSSRIDHYVQFSYQSDDRYKSYEVPIGGATAVLEQLLPLTYKKHPSLRTDDPAPDLSDVEWFTESGFIAQDVERIPQLAYLVGDAESSDDSGETTKSLVYTDLIAWLVAGFQEQQTLIADLTTRLAALEN